MISSDAHKLFRTLLNAGYFSLAMAAFVFLFVTYSGTTLISVPITLLTLTYVLAGVCAVYCLVRRDFLAGSSVYVLSGATQKVIRITALLLPVPALVFATLFFNCLITFDGSNAAVERVLNLSQVETGVFGKSALLQLLRHDSAATNQSDDMDLSPYIVRLQEKIKQHCDFSQMRRSDQVVVQIKVLRDGTLADVALVSSSGSASADQAAITAIKSCAPLEPLPSAAPSDIDIQYTFDSHQQYAIEDYYGKF